MKMWKRALSFLLVLAMLAGFVPAADLAAFAAGKTEVAQIETRLSAEHVPYAGMKYKDLYTWIDAVIYGRAQNSGSDWVDDSGMTIEIKGDGDYGEWYDIRYQFEAGRTYTAEYTYMINPAYEETHMFTERTTVTLTNPDPSKCTITGEVIEVRDSGRICDVRYTMTIAGERSYPDIEAATLQKIKTPADGVQAETTALMYSNCTLTAQSWSPNVGIFEAGNTYTLTVNLHAKEGYKFADDFAPVLGVEGYEKAASSVELLNNNKDAVVSFTYSVGNYAFIDTLELKPITGAADFLPVAGESALYFPDLFKPVDGAPYEKEWLSSRQWYNEDDRNYMEDGDVFEAGKTYSYYSIFKIKTENEGTHRFASPTVQIENFIYQNDVQTEVGDDPLRIYVTFYYTCRFPEGVGDSAGNPAVCHTYNEFKYAMESKDIRYVALGDINETMPVGEEGLVTAIRVNGIKNLLLLGDATFTAPAMTQTTYAALLHTTQNTTLNISGAGSLTFKAVANNSYNAVIYNQGGSVNIYEGTLIGSYNTAVYGKAIWQEYGDLRISGGQLFAENALAPLALPVAHTAVYIKGGQAWIQGGTFKTESHINTIDLHYGLDIGQYATVDLSGGTFYGILLPTSSTPLANYMDEDLYTPLSDGSRFNPESEYSQGYVESGKVVRIVWLIDHVDVHINAPIAGVEITENYFNVPTSGCQAAMYYPMWYKNGEPVTYGTFEAGASYKVVVRVEPKPGHGIEFASGITVALNNRNASLKSHGAHYVEFEYDFGACPNIIPEVALTVTAPKEGNTPSYTIGCGSDAYYAVGNNQNYTDYRQWYESSDGEVWWKINPGSKFTADYYYKLVVDISTKNGYEFPLIDNGTIQPNVSATVNGYYANVIKAYEQDPSCYVTVEYNFGECSDSIVEKITVENVTAPVAGEKPNYNYSIRGGGYQMNTAKNAYEDIYWKNPPEQWYFIKNGIGWYDLTKNDWVYEHETFIAGHEYQVRVYVKAEDGFEFAHTKDYEPTVTATVNGKTAAPITTGSDCAWYQQVQYTFTCKKQDVSTVMINSLDAPQKDSIPDREVSTAYPDLYTVEFINWYDSEDNLLYGEDTFRAGERYKVEIKIVPKQLGGVNASQFVSPVKGYINGQEVTERLDWDAVYASANAVYIYYTFMAPAGAPQNQSYTVSGEVVSYDGDPSGTLIQLIPYGTTEVAYETVLSANGTYSVQNVQEGIYLIYFSKSGYITREFIINVAGGVVQNCVMMRDYSYLKGDVDNDGDVDMDDAIYLLYHVNFQSTYPVNQPVDFNGDSKEDLDDAIYLLYHVNFPASYPLH